MPWILIFVLLIAAVGYGLVELLSNWMSTGAAVLVTVVIFLGLLAYLASIVRRRIRLMMANPALAGLVRGGGIAALGLLALRNPKLLFSLGSTYLAMRRNRPPPR